VSLVPGVDDLFWNLLVADAARLPGGPSPFDLAALMLSESGLTPTAKHVNADGSIEAIGINQLDKVNWPAFNVDPGSYLASPASAQWAGVVRPFFSGILRAHPQAAASLRDLYWLNFAPATYVPNAPDDHVIVKAGPEDAGLASPDGSVRAGDLTRFALRAQSAAPGRWASIHAAISNALLQEPGRGTVEPTGPGAPSAKRLGAGGLVLGVAGAFLIGTLAIGRRRT
jgi:hypothetical protein